MWKKRVVFLTQEVFNSDHFSSLSYKQENPSQLCSAIGNEKKQFPKTKQKKNFYFILDQTTVFRLPL